MDSSGKPLVYGKLYQLENIETGRVVTLEPKTVNELQFVNVTVDQTYRPMWTWNWTLAVFPAHSWHWHDMAEILNESE